MRKINKIVVHSTVTPQDWEVEDILDIFYNDYGWNNPGYHYIVETSGFYENVLDIADIANGVKGHNDDSIHIAFIGGGTDDDGNAIDNRTVEQCVALEHICDEMIREFTEAELMGHRDLSPDLDDSGEVEPDEWIKLCPCFDVSEWAKTVELK